MTFKKKKNCLYWRFDAEQVLISPWGTDSLRIQSTQAFDFSTENWALTEKVTQTETEIEINESVATLRNGNIRAIVSKNGKLTFQEVDTERILLEEYVRTRDFRQNTEDNYYNEEILNNFNSALKLYGREYKPIVGGDYKLTVRFESSNNEKLFGMGQYQQPDLDLKHMTLELAHRNSQASVPFMLSNKGYGFLWNNPAIGRVTFGKNMTEWVSESTSQVDYWITTGKSPRDIQQKYASVVGKAPTMPDYAMGLWQSKLRYQSQEEILEVAREYKNRNLPLSIIVIDYFHWPYEGDFRFDEELWPDPQAMVDELKSMGIEVMVSVWPTIDKRSENYTEMKEKGYLVRVDRGMKTTKEFMGNTLFYDPTHPEAREFVWDKVKQNYYDYGIKVFWLDEAEPEFDVYDFDNIRYAQGSNLKIGNIYPLMFSRNFYEGMMNEGQEEIINLVRTAWVGSHKYGALVWSGDIDSSFESLRNQLQSGLNMGIAGIPWWTTDIGGFHGGDPEDEAFRELFVRWFQFGAFCPVFRIHGDREPHTKPLTGEGAGRVVSGAANEVWSYGEEAYPILENYIFVREKLKPYIKKITDLTSQNGDPIMRPLFYDFSDDPSAWEVTDQYMFGPDIMVAPVLYANQRQRDVYFPIGTDWVEAKTNQEFEGGSTALIEAPLSYIPVFFRKGTEFDLY